MTLPPTPACFADLTPQQVLDALDAAGLQGDGRVLQLNSYENRVYQVFLEDGQAVVPKFYRPGRWSDAQILEEHAFALELEAAEVPVVAPLILSTSLPGADSTVQLAGEPPTLARLPTAGGLHRFSVSPRRAGRAPELDDAATLAWLGRFIGRLHAVGARKAFAHRRRMEPAADGAAALATLERSGFIPEAMRPQWSAVTRSALDRVAAAFDRVDDRRWLRLHGDCHPGNVLWRDEGPHVVDLDDACSGPAVQDLWMLVSGDAASMAAQLARLLRGYRQFADFDPRELALIEPLRTFRMIRHSAWIAERWTNPAFPAAFPWFDTPAHWTQQLSELRQQIEAMDEPPLDLWNTD